MSDIYFIKVIVVFSFVCLFVSLFQFVYSLACSIVRSFFCFVLFCFFVFLYHFCSFELTELPVSGDRG